MPDSSINNIISETMDSTEKVEVKPEVSETPKTEEVQEQPETESFAEKGELKGLTEEKLQETYDNWNKAYTAKRQKETAELKQLRTELEELRAKSGQVPQSEGLKEAQVEAQRQVDLGNMSIQEYTEYMRKQLLEEARAVVHEEYKTITTQEKETQLAEKALEDFETADPRFKETDPHYDEDFRSDVQRELAELVDKHLQETGSYKGFDTTTIVKQIIGRKDTKADEIIKKRTQESTKAAKMREAKLRKSEVRGTTSESQKIGGDSIKSILEETVASMA